MRLKIQADGSVYGTRVIDGDTGRQVEAVRSVQFRHMAGGVPEIDIEFICHELAAVGERVRFYIPGIGYIRAVELEDGKRIDLPQLEEETEG